MDKKERFYKLLKDNKFVFWDGAMGTMLQAKGMEMGGIPEMLNFNKPDWIYEDRKSTRLNSSHMA